MVRFSLFKIRKTRHQDGFGLVELVVVISIMLIAAAVVVPNLRSSYSRHALYVAARQMAGDIRYCQQQAVSIGEESYQILFDTDSERYFFKFNTKSLNTVTLLPTIDLVAVRFPGNTTLLQFTRTGKPLPGGGTITLQDKVTRSFYYVIVAPITGRVRISPTPPASWYDG